MLGCVKAEQLLALKPAAAIEHTLYNDFLAKMAAIFSKFFLQVAEAEPPGSQKSQQRTVNDCPGN